MSEARAERTRAEDVGFLCVVAQRFSQAWDFIDKRDIDKHVTAWLSFYITWFLINWILNFVWVYPDKPGLEVAAIVAAVLMPWTPVQAAVVKWYFESRTE
jgi:hypothetical protein